eukprot:4949239-Lingulodinium_polyedra.AAC.1
MRSVTETIVQQPLEPQHRIALFLDTRHGGAGFQHSGTLAQAAHVVAALRRIPTLQARMCKLGWAPEAAVAAYDKDSLAQALDGLATWGVG